MSRLLHSERLSEMLIIFGRKIELLSANNQLHWNIYAENLMIPLLNSILKTNLSNINQEVKGNYPAIDLVDREKKVVVQITSEDSFNKVKNTCEKFVSHATSNEYKEIYFVFLKEKARCYNNFTQEKENQIKELLGKEMIFDKKTHLLDFSRIHDKSQSVHIEELGDVIRCLELELGKMTEYLQEKGPVVTLIFNEQSELDLAYEVTKGLISVGIRVKYFSAKLKTKLNEQHLNSNFCELIYDVSKEARTNIILSTNKLKENIKNNTISAPILETLKNQHHLHLLFRLETKATFSDFDWIRPQVIIASAEKVQSIVEHISHQVRKIQIAKEIKTYDDFETMIRLFDNKSKIITNERVIESRKGVGYSFIETRDLIKVATSYYLYLYEGSLIKPSAENFYLRFSHVKPHQQNLILFLSKEIDQKQLEERLFNAKKWFKAGVAFYLDEFIWKHCTDSEVVENDEVRKFSDVENFITPKIFSKTGSVTDFDVVENWFSTQHDPVLVITGSGGIGKTTATKVIVDRFQKYKQYSRIYFIEASDPDVITYLIRTSEHKKLDLYDFYKAANSYSAIDRDLFRLNIDNGNFLLVIDGLDEVFARIPGFDIDDFIANISDDFIRGIGVGKIIITCRSFFWSDQVSKDTNINHFEILPFNYELTQQFFESKFKEKSLIKKSLKLVNQFDRNFNEVNGEIMPYVLDVVAKIVEAGDEFDLEEIRSVPYLNLENKTDYVIYKLFQREQKKTLQLTVEEQCRFFIHFAVYNDGKVSETNLFQAWENNFNTHLTNNACEMLKSHPLLQTAQGQVYFRYNFFENYFKTIYLANFISITNIDELSPNLVKILLNDVRFGSSILLDVANRCETWSEDHLLRISDIIRQVRSHSFSLKDAPAKYKERIISGLFSLALTVNQNKKGDSLRENTELIKSLFEVSPNNLEGTCFVNVNTGVNVRFDFSGLLLKNCYFDNYESFWECHFDQNTLFVDSTFFNLGFPQSNTSKPAETRNFLNAKKDSSFDEYFTWQSSKNHSRIGEITLLLEKYFKMYYSNGHLRAQRQESIIHRRYNSRMHSVIKVDTLEGILKQNEVVRVYFDKVSGENKIEITQEYKEDITKFLKETTIGIKIKRIIDQLIDV